ncbi:hypothetical protein SEA_BRUTONGASTER_89 [Gordonia phage BrutonGaster]|uniref:Uncharacterized protein n=1 Tax=Gordonia phage BrutonGaster TaxID=2530116 RepID=A0A482JN68_9CAUD|nr:hypothetical protein HOV26_gp093 [Gordonia phage BrutonGaster]QBP33304.1 hypothetical protein SEA_BRUTONGASTER_89 [Gordonia phage BrutonGaster]
MNKDVIAALDLIEDIEVYMGRMKTTVKASTIATVVSTLILMAGAAVWFTDAGAGVESGRWLLFVVPGGIGAVVSLGVLVGAVTRRVQLSDDLRGAYRKHRDAIDDIPDPNERKKAERHFSYSYVCSVCRNQVHDPIAKAAGF